MPAIPHPTPGAILIGDPLNMRHFITGGGMTVALSDIVVLRDLLKPLHDLSDAPSVHIPRILLYLPHEQGLLFFILLCMQPVASTVNTIAGALYAVFSPSPDQARKELQQAIFGYLRLGDVFLAIYALFAGLNPHALSLVLHLIPVVTYTVGRLLLPFPSPKRMWLGARLIWVRFSSP
ncbi:hypothetical protein ACLB2K_003836 [Fragaria x ananassa]